MSTTQHTECLMMAVMVEISGANWLVASYAGGQARPRRKSLAQEQPQQRFEALLEEIATARKRLGVAQDARVVVAYEAGQEGFWLVRALRGAGIEAEVIDPVSLPVARRARRAKTDRLDAEALVVALWRYLQGDRQALRMVRVPSEEEEDSREWQRERDRLKQQAQGCADRIRKKLRTHGIWVLPKHWGVALRGAELRTFAGKPLGHTLQQMLVMELERLELAQAKLQALEKMAAELCAAARQRIDALVQLCGIGRCGARALSTQLYWRTFENGRQVGACVGMVGVPYDSGVLRQDQGISKVGDPKLRALLVELSWLWLRYQPNSAITQWFMRRTQGAGRRGKRVMIVAVARRLAVALWRYLAQGIVPEGARLKAALATM
jgi:transposase